MGPLNPVPELFQWAQSSLSLLEPSSQETNRGQSPSADVATQNRSFTLKLKSIVHVPMLAPLAMVIVPPAVLNWR